MSVGDGSFAHSRPITKHPPKGEIKFQPTDGLACLDQVVIKHFGQKPPFLGSLKKLSLSPICPDFFHLQTFFHTVIQALDRSSHKYISRDSDQTNSRKLKDETNNVLYITKAQLNYRQQLYEYQRWFQQKTHCFLLKRISKRRFFLSFFTMFSIVLLLYMSQKNCSFLNQDSPSDYLCKKIPMYFVQSRAISDWVLQSHCRPGL